MGELWATLIARCEISGALLTMVNGVWCMVNGKWRWAVGGRQVTVNSKQQLTGAHTYAAQSRYTIQFP